MPLHPTTTDSESTNRAQTMRNITARERAETTMQITVTQEHINEGKRLDCEKCPIALALSEATGLSWSAGMMLMEASSTPPQVFPAPQSCIRFMGRFDEGIGEAVKPFTFEIPGLEVAA